MAEKLSREKRGLLTLSEEREIERLVARIAEELAIPVKLSHMLRAYYYNEGLLPLGSQCDAALAM